MNKVVKSLLKTLENQKNTLNTFDQALSKPKKSKSQIDHTYYQKHKEKKKVARRKRYAQQKEQTQQGLNKYYGAEAIKILISFKEYTELNSAKKKLWLDFNWTLKDCRESFLKGFGNVVAVMKLAQVADNLIKDYWTTAKSEKQRKNKSWNSLDYDEQQRLIRYWSYEKARIENGYLDEEEKLARQSQEYLKEIERDKFHEERGKIKCECGWCEQERVIRGEVKNKIKKELENYDRESGIKDKEQCPECNRWVKELDEENGICKNCLENYV
ncbi:MAG: hypothetical protein I3270_02545 [Candidatus Moeniiplasma glomeromycotorum]|nr:hypothetical protein [Candidatus Moeniiplasma glomeromycotorum]MCE8162574.1 hypothetical protein [Candidatus Moeniiplasma glomeromycotorum]MCE8166502.1 hypothetical protein [Candidatus Moeniiplasma glomeromycotorum]MCE8166957.1 hypothetical protein [Candidatus Moeniiplasma glomeromycotorum]